MLWKPLICSRLPAVIVGVIGIGLSISAGLFVRDAEETEFSYRFQEAAEQRFKAVNTEIITTLGILDLLGSFFESSTEVTRAEFKRFTASTFIDRFSVHAFGWVPHIPNSARGRFEKDARDQGLPKFRIKELLEPGKMVVAVERKEYFPISYVEPLKGNEFALGFDLASEPVRLSALRDSIDSGEMRATARITPVQVPEQYGFLVFRPIYDTDAVLDSVENRRKSLRGLGLAVFRIGDIMAKSVRPTVTRSYLPSVSLHLYDLAAPAGQRLLYPKDSRNVEPTELYHGHYLEETLDVADRRWLLVATPATGIATNGFGPQAWLTLLAGLLFTLLLTTYLWTRIRQSEEVRGWAEALERNEKRLVEAQSIARLGNWEWDLETDEHLCTEAACDILGLPKGNLKPSIDTFYDSIHPDDRVRVVEAIHVSIQKKKPLAIEFSIALPGGEFRHIQSRGKVVTNAAGTRSKFLATVQDVTEQRHAAEEKEELERDLREAQKLEAIGQLAGGIAHEINTPAQYVGNNLKFLSDAFRDLFDLLDKCFASIDKAKEVKSLAPSFAEVYETKERIELDYLNEEIPAATEQSIFGIEQISHIVLAMKEFSHPGSKEKTPNDINRTLKNTITISRNEWKHHAKVETNFDSSLPAVSCLPGELNQVFLNLIVNAAHAIAAAERAAEDGLIRVTTGIENGLVVIQVEDNGTGIPEEIRDQVFNPFFTTKQVGKGSGQGLAIARDIVVAKHGGSIRFDSKPGKGTCFRVELPIHPPE